MNDVDAGLLVFGQWSGISEAVHPAKALRHAFQRAQIANQMFGGKIDANFAGAGADKVNGFFRVGLAFVDFAFRC